jgi:hypothetical protein
LTSSFLWFKLKNLPKGRSSFIKSSIELKPSKVESTYLAKGS